MRYKLSEEEIELNNIIRPYLEWQGVSSKLKSDAPEKVKKAYERLMEIAREQDKLEMELL